MTIADHDRDELEKVERLNAFFAGEPMDRPRRDLSIGLSDAEQRQHDEARFDAAFTELIDCDEADGIDELVIVVPGSGCDDQEAAAEAAEPTYERVDDAPALTPYDKARQAVTDAEILRDVAEPGSDEYHRAMADLAEKKRAFKVEQERATDPTYRKRRATDEWRAGLGRDEYNASRRDKERPNTMTPKDVLNAMTPEERAQHVKDQKADSANRARATMKFGPDGQGLTGAALTEAVEAAVEQARARRLAKRA